MKTLPDFSLPGSDGRTWTRDDLAAQTTILYFYPRDATPGCTREACGFRDAMARLAAKGVRVVGVSPDPLESHAAFIAQERLPFVLLSDPAGALAESCGAWGAKPSGAKGIIRSTFLVARGGAVLREWRAVRVDGHVEEVLAALT